MLDRTAAEALGARGVGIIKFLCRPDFYVNLVDGGYQPTCTCDSRCVFSFWTDALISQLEALRMPKNIPDVSVALLYSSLDIVFMKYTADR